MVVKKMYLSFKVAVSRDFCHFLNPWIQPTWVPDKRAKMVLLKNSFSRRYSRNKCLHADLHCAKSNFRTFEYLHENEPFSKSILACLSGAQVDWIQIGFMDKKMLNIFVTLGLSFHPVHKYLLPENFVLKSLFSVFLLLVQSPDKKIYRTASLGKGFNIISLKNLVCKIMFWFTYNP